MTKVAASPKPGWLQASGWLFLLLQVANLCNYLFHAVSSRMLGPAEYGVFVSMLAFITIMSIPSQAIQTVLAKHFAVDDTIHSHARIYSVAYYILLHLLLVGLLLALGLGLASPWLKDFFHLSSVGPLLMVALATIVMFSLPVARGLLQGLQFFRELGLNTLVDGLVRLGMGSLLLWLGLGVEGAIGAGILSGAAAFFLAFFTLKWLRQEERLPLSELHLGALYQVMVPVLAAFGAFLIITSLDVMMVKHYFPALQAGYYSAGSMVGKVFLFLPVAIAQVLLPKASAGHALAEDTRSLLHKSLLATGAVLLVGLAGVWLLARLVVLTLFGSRFLNPETLRLVEWFGLAITPVALVYILLQYNLALHNLRFIAWLCLDILLLLALLVMFHQTLGQVLFWVGVNHTALFIIGYLLTPRRQLAKG